MTPVAESIMTTGAHHSALHGLQKLNRQSSGAMTNNIYLPQIQRVHIDTVNIGPETRIGHAGD